MHLEMADDGAHMEVDKAEAEEHQGTAANKEKKRFEVKK
jgi:hypothetical protein